MSTHLFALSSCPDPRGVTTTPCRPAMPVVPPGGAAPALPRIGELAFDPDRGLVVTVNRDGVLAIRVVSGAWA